MLSDLNKTPAAAAAGATPATAAPATTAPAPSYEIQNKAIEELVSQWSSEIDELVRLFRKQAKEITQTDMKVLENGERITELFTEVEQTRREQQEVESHLEYINAQQTELHKTLQALENELATVISQTQHGAADDQRQK